MRVLKLAIVVFLSLLAGCTRGSLQNDNDQTTIATTFFPLYELTRLIATDKETFSLVPAGAEPHDYDPTPSDIIKLSKADAFVTLGLEFLEFENRVIKGSGKEIRTIDASKEIKLLEALEDEHEEELTEENEHKNSGKDPHIWLSPNNMISMARNINKDLKLIYPEKSQSYDSNTNKLITELKNLDVEFKEGLSNCKKNTVLVSHRAFAYLANEYGFSQISISGLEPENEPSPKELIKLEQEAKEHNISYIFYEELVDPRVSQTIAREIGAMTLELNPLEGTKDRSQTYFTLMRKNLVNLRIALECK